MRRQRTDVVLIVSSFLPRFGGVEEHVLNVARALHASGTTVAIWAADQGDPDVPSRVDGIRIRYLPCPLPSRSLSGLSRALLRSPKAIMQWTRAWWLDRPRVLHVQCFGPNGVYAYALSRASGLPLIVSAHGETFMDAHDLFGTSALMRRVLTMALRSAVVVTGCSQFAIDDLVNRFGLERGRGHVVFNGVDLEEAGGPPPVDLPDRYILGVGRLVDTK